MAAKKERGREKEIKRKREREKERETETDGQRIGSQHVHQGHIPNDLTSSH
jgi:hypothetical protein